MIVSSSHRVVISALASVMLVGCTAPDWPLPKDLNRPSPQSPSKSTGDSPAFIGASAVTVGAGDTVFAIARRHRVPMRALIEANNLKPPYHLALGQRLVLPRGPVHLVAKGDTLSAIAVNYDVHYTEIARLNGLEPPYLIRVGERLSLPGGVVQPAQTQLARAQPFTSRAPSSRTGEPPAGKQVIAVSPSAGKSDAPAKPPAAAKAAAPKPAKPKAIPVPPAPRTKPVLSAQRPAAATPVPKPPARAGKGFIWPVKGKVISSFGAKSKGLRNDGINIAAPHGTTVRAAENGVVAYAGNELRGFGNLLLIKHAGGWVSAYAHNQKLLVKRGQKIRRGQSIATVGSTGNVARPQLHFELRKGKRARDPKRLLRGSA